MPSKKNIKKKSLSSQGHDLVKTHQWPEKDKESEVQSPVFGLKCPKQLGYYDRDSSSLKTYQESGHEGSTKSLEKLPPSGLMRSGRVFVPQTSGRGTKGKGSGSSLIPTLTTHETEHPDAHLTETGRRKSKNGKDTSHSLNLADLVRLLPTSTARDYKDTGNLQNVPANSLLGRVLGKLELDRLLPTVRANPAMMATITSESAHDAKRSPNLETILGRVLLPTPRSREGNAGKPGSQSSKTNARRHYLDGTLQEMEISGEHTGLRLQLSCAFCEWHMGFPKDFTRLDSYSPPKPKRKTDVKG